MAAKKKHVYEYPRPSVTADLVLITNEKPRCILLIRRKHPPYEGSWALPGGFVNEGETLEAAAQRELMEETNLKVKGLRQLQTFGDPGRDPRGWTVTVAFLGLVNAAKLKPAAADDAAEVAWHSLDSLPRLAFDHAKIIRIARKRIDAAESQN
jgi:8-oxo-dGTP diphosphatase